ncbi:hypothetical protein ZTR_04747 [Talaromyces verruculosus]|nr:hypothetical protein ZTR_04747 [Talaromyces verruculosus]
MADDFLTVLLIKVIYHLDLSLLYTNPLLQNLFGQHQAQLTWLYKITIRVELSRSIPRLSPLAIRSYSPICGPPLTIMAFAEGTTVTFPTDCGEATIGTVKGFKDGKYQIEIEGGKLVEVEEADVKEFVIEMNRRDIFDYLK